MWPESAEAPRPLRTGLTTGTCATACALAAATYLLCGHRPEPEVAVTLPKGKRVTLKLVHLMQTESEQAQASTIKDAGDDPDVTHGAKVTATVTLTVAAGVRFKAGEGVGTVTKPGLALAVGEPAINPVPRKMISEHLQALAQQQHYTGGFEVIISVANGAELAQKTMNPRLGILGGLSILGTTGIVRPFSCAAYIASIHQGIDVALANGQQHLAAATGNMSEQAIATHWQLPAVALIEMGDFAGAVLKYVRTQPLQRLSLCGGFGKFSKLAAGALDLHSRASAVSMAFLATEAAAVGADPELQAHISAANTSIEALTLAQNQGIALADRICELAMARVRHYVPATVAVDISVTNRQGELVGMFEDLGSQGRV